jgi:hypothetical protein
MSFFDRLRPKWNHSDPAIREQAISGLEDQKQLAKIVGDDPSEAVRLAAVGRLTDQGVLEQLAGGKTSLALPAMKRLTDPKVILRMAVDAELGVVREMAVDRIEDGAALNRIAASDPDARVRLRARTRSPWPNPTRDFLQKRLSALSVAPAPPEFPPEFCGTLEEVCGALVGDGRFRINGGVEQGEPVGAAVRDQTTVPFSGSTNGTVPDVESCAQFLAFKRGASGEPETTGAAKAYYQVTVWRTDQNVFQCCAREKSIAVTNDAVVWSRSSSGTAHAGRGAATTVGAE